MPVRKCFLRAVTCGQSGTARLFIFRNGVRALAWVCTLLFGSLLATAGLAAQVPLPKPRPAQAPRTEPAVQTDQREAPVDAAPPSQAAPAVAPALSACRLALTDAIAIAPSLPPIRGPGDCGGEDIVRLEAVVVSPTQRVALKPPAVLRCTMATAVANWVRADAAPLAASLGSLLSEVDNFDSFECRGRNRVKGAKLSEHGRANALDVRGLRLANGTVLSLTDRNLSRDIREKVLHSVCTRFTTVLGPGSDWYHEDHIHLDIAERRNNYKLCQWNVYDPMPQIAPLLPAARPDEAPAHTPEEEAGETAGEPEGRAEPPAQDSDAAKRKPPRAASGSKPAARPERRP
ncbi:MAG: extensin family protein [Afipia sp.]|nr:extensin family protein [Afipia sp.]